MKFELQGFEQINIKQKIKTKIIPKISKNLNNIEKLKRLQKEFYPQFFIPILGKPDPQTPLVFYEYPAG